MAPLASQLVTDPNLPDMPDAAQIVGNAVAAESADEQQARAEAGADLDASALERIGVPASALGLPTPLTTVGYVRMVVHVDGQQATLSAVRRVEGPLVTAGAVGGGNIWEVLVGGQRVASDTVGDLTTWRSFPDPQSPEQGHHITESSSYDLTVRIPLGRVTAADLGRTELRLSRISSPEGGFSLAPTGRPLAEEFPGAVEALLVIPRLDDPALGPLVGRLQELLG
jgi:hypothetical protein